MQSKHSQELYQMLPKIDLTRKKFIAIALICLMLGFVVGFLYGAEQTLNKCASLASDFIEVDYEQVREMIELYDRYRWKIK